MKTKNEIQKELCNCIFAFTEINDYDKELLELELPVRVKEGSNFPKYKFHYMFKTEKGTFRWATNKEL